MATFPPTHPGDLQDLMEQIRQNSARSWTDIMKAAKVQLMEKRTTLDASERQQFSSCLEILQKAAPVTSRKERQSKLEEMAVKSGLKFGTISADQFFLSRDCFYVEISVGESGLVTKLTIFHGNRNDQRTECSSLIELLNSCEWDGVLRHFNGLASMYDIEGVLENRLLGLNAVEAIERELNETEQPGHRDASVKQRIFHSPVAMLLPRDGGIPTQVCICAAPYDLMHVDGQIATDLSPEEVIRKMPGDWVYVTITPYNSVQQLCLNKLTTETCELPALFALKFSKSFAVCQNIIEQLEELTGFPVYKVPNFDAENVLSLLIKKEIPDWKLSKGLPVNLPDQTHKYILDPSAHKHLVGTMISSVTFNDVSLVAQLIVLLRKQAIFNCIVESIIRPKSTIETGEEFTKVDVTFPSIDSLELIFEHPTVQEILRAKVEFGDPADFNTNLTNLTSADGTAMCSQEDFHRVFNRCWSIPVTMRYVLNKTKEMNPTGDSMETNEHERDGDHNGESDRGGKSGPSGMNGHTLADYSSSVFPSTSDGFGFVHSGSAPNRNSFLFYSAFGLSAVECAKLSSSRKSAGELSAPTKLSVTDSASTSDVHVGETRKNNSTGPSLLDLFKEVDEDWKELIPPKPPVPQPPPPLRLPLAPLINPNFNRMKQPIEPLMSPTGPPSQMPYGMTPKSPKSRHMSTASDTFGDLDTLCQLSKSITGEHGDYGNVGFVSTPTSDRPGSRVGVNMERKSSIQDTIDNLVHYSPHANLSRSPGHSTSSYGQMPPHLAHQQIHGQHMTRPPMLQPQQPLSQMASGSNEFQKSQSLDYDLLLEHTDRGDRPTGMDEFDFEKSDPLEAGLIDYQRGRSYSTQEGMPGQPSNFYHNLQETIYNASGSAEHFALLRGARGSLRRRRTRRAMANVGDRTVEMAMREMKKEKTPAVPRGSPGMRRPRKQRGSPQMSAQPNMQQFYSSGASPYGPSGMNMGEMGEEMPGGTPQAIRRNLSSVASTVPYSLQGLEGNVDPTFAAQQNFDRSYSYPSDVGMPDERPNSQQFAVKNPPPYPYGESATPAANRPSGPKIEPPDASLRTNEDEDFDEEVETINHGDPTEDTVKGIKQEDGGDNLFENLSSSLHFQSIGESHSGESSQGMVAKTAKPASLFASRRKSSTLDAVIGKLMENASAIHPAVGPFSEMGESGDYELGEPASKRFCPENIFEQISGDNYETDPTTRHDQDSNSSEMGQRMTSKGSDSSLSSIPGGGESGGSLKLVIKRTDIKFSTGNGGGQRPLSSLGSKLNPMKRPTDLVAKQVKMRDSPILKRSLSGSNMNENPAGTPGGSNSKTSTPDKLRPDIQDKKGAATAALKQHLSETMSGNKFDMLKEKIREKKLKKIPDVKGDKPHSTPKSHGKASDKQILSPHSKQPKAEGSKKSSTPQLQKGPAVAAPLVPGGIYPGVDMFPAGKTLKRFKIPKIEDSQKPAVPSSPMPSQPATQQQIQPPTTPSKTVAPTELAKKPDDQAKRPSSTTPTLMSRTPTTPGGYLPVAGGASMKSPPTGGMNKPGGQKFNFMSKPSGFQQNPTPTRGPQGFPASDPRLQSASRPQPQQSSSAISSVRKPLLPDPSAMGAGRGPQDLSKVNRVWARPNESEDVQMGDESTRSPEENMLVIDDTVKSPAAGSNSSHNTSGGDQSLIVGEPSGADLQPTDFQPSNPSPNLEAPGIVAGRKFSLNSEPKSQESVGGSTGGSIDLMDEALLG